METIIITLIGLFLSYVIIYFIIRSAVKNAVVPQLHKTNELLKKLLESKGIDHSDILTRNQKLNRIETGQQKLFSDLSEGKIDKATYDREYNKLGLQRNEL